MTGRALTRWTRRPLGTGGFSLIELTFLIIVFAVLAAVAMQSMMPAIEDARRTKTDREMAALADAIVGRPQLGNDGAPADFGYVGDIGAFPPNLDALISNPGGWPTWNGPYVPSSFAEDSSGFRTDEWGATYGYSGSLTITSTGSGSTISHSIPGDVDAFLYNTLSITIADDDGNPPGLDLADSIPVTLTYPDGVGGMVSTTVYPDSSGDVTIDSIPVGHHRLEIVYEPEADTLTRYIAVLPRHKEPLTYKFFSNHFDGGGGEDPEPEDPNGPVGHWALDDSTGSTALDSSGYDNHGTLYNMDLDSCWIDSGQVNGCLAFDGIDDHIQVSHAAELNGTTQLTYAAWIYPTNWTGTRQVMAKSVHGGGSGRVQMGIFGAGGSLTGRAETYAGRFDISTGQPPLDQWSHVALVFDSVGMRLYVNDTVKASRAFTMTSLRTNSDPLCISKRVGTNQYFFSGRIDDVRIYTRALDDAEIGILYNLGN